MKKQIIIAGLVSVILAPPALAVTKCVALNSSTTCTSNYNSYYNKTDWAATCITNGVSTPISGIGICSNTEESTAGSLIYPTATEIDTSSIIYDNRYCWCKMTSPAVSRWVYNSSYSSADNCSESCTRNCAHSIHYTASFRSALFGSLSD